MVGGHLVVDGSSPRGRGKLKQRLQSQQHTRLIPAWAGKTACELVDGGPTVAHPRVGGENRAPTQAIRLAPGSSPRGRGKLGDVLETAGARGLIPAWAGKTSRPGSPPAALRAHPRVGGENSTKLSITGVTLGSSPRGRGKRNCQSSRPIWHGLIPAWAGKTDRGRSVPRQSTAHPRVGGENMMLFSCPS